MDPRRKTEGLVSRKKSAQHVAKIRAREELDPWFWVSCIPPYRSGSWLVRKKARSVFDRVVHNYRKRRADEVELARRGWAWGGERIKRQARKRAARS